MKTEIIDNGKQVIAKFSGRLDTAAAVQTAEDVKPLMDKAGKEIILTAPNWSTSRHPDCVYSWASARKQLLAAAR